METLNLWIYYLNFRAWMTVQHAANNNNSTSISLT